MVQFGNTDLSFIKLNSSKHNQNIT